MRVVAVVAHPDDEVLGVGGTLARHRLDGDTVKVVIVCANTFRGQIVDSDVQTRGAMQALGIDEYQCLGYDDQKLEENPFSQIVMGISLAVAGFDLLYTHWYKDLNRDHRIVNEAVQLIARPQYGRKFEVREFPTPSSTEYSREPFVPDTWVDIGSTLERKIMAMDCYKSELQELPLPRNVQRLMVIAAAIGSQVGLMAAEHFSTARRVL